MSLQTCSVYLTVCVSVERFYPSSSSFPWTLPRICTLAKTWRIICRFVAVCRPLKAKYLCTHARYKRTSFQRLGRCFKKSEFTFFVLSLLFLIGHFCRARIAVFATCLFSLGKITSLVLPFFKTGIGSKSKMTIFLSWKKKGGEKSWHFGRGVLRLKSIKWQEVQFDQPWNFTERKIDPSALLRQIS